MIGKSGFSGWWQGKNGICVALVGTLLIIESQGVVAQVVPDNTLGAESSVVTPDVIQGIESDRIDGGATRGANLFHSFEQFDIGAGRGAYFTNPAGIANIFSRVTGANRSDILGRLGVLGNANLFLINPNGIVFGSDTSLDVQGSFLATTADAIKLGDGGLFSATQPNISNLLTVSPSAILFNTIAAQPIVNQSLAQSAIDQTNSDGGSPGLQVRSGQTLGLVGGNVLLEGGRLTAAGGRIELGSVAGVGEVSLIPSGNRFELGYEAIADFGNISLSNGAFVDASGEGGGDVQVRGERLEMAQGSNIWADTSGAENGGEVLVRATEVVLSENSLLSANVTSTGTGTGGNLTIDTGRLLASDGSRARAITQGNGKNGNLQVVADDSVELIGRSADGRFGSGLYTQNEGSGDAGNLTIDTGRLLVQDGARVSASAVDAGKGGSLQIVATESVELIGTSADGQFLSGLYAGSSGSGDAGNLTIDTGRLLVQGGALVSVGAVDAGKGGSLQIVATESVELIGRSADNGLLSGLYAGSEGSGDGGNLTIDTGRLLVQGGAQVSVSPRGSGKGGSLQIFADDSIELIGTSADGQFLSGLYAQSSGSGDGGNLTIDTKRLLVQGGAKVSVGTFGAGKSGSLQIFADDSVEVIGTSADSGILSGLYAQSEGSGNGGNLTIDTGRLLVQDGAVVSINTFGAGKGGSLQIVATESVEVIGTSADGRVGSVSAQSEGSGDAGNLTIDTGRLLVQGGAQVRTNTFGAGKGGSLQIVATESVEVIGTSADGQSTSGLSAQSVGSGNGGNLTIDTRRLLVQGGAVVGTGTFGVGKSGSLQIVADDSVEVIGTSADGQFLSGLFAPSEGSGDGGNLTINTGRLLVRDGAVVLVGTTSEGTAGSLQIVADESVEVIGTSDDSQFLSGLFAGSSGSGDGGNLTLDTGRLLVSGGATITSRSRGDGTAGNINIKVRDTLQADDGTISTNTSRSSGGTIAIKAGNIRLIGDSNITTNVNSGAGGGGNITLTADSILAFDDSDILAFARDGRGGDITFNTPAFFGENYRPAPSNTNPDTLNNNNRVDINATGAVSGIIVLPDVSFIQNSLIELTENQLNTDTILANSCIVRRDQRARGSFTITGTGGLPQRPGDAQMSSFPTVDVETLPSDSTHSNINPNRAWQKGDPIVEPQGAYRLPNGKLVLSRECS